MSQQTRPFLRVWPPSIVHTTTAAANQLIASFDTATLHDVVWNDAIFGIEARIVSAEDTLSDDGGLTILLGSVKRKAGVLTLLQSGGAPMAASLAAADIVCNADNHTVEIRVQPGASSYTHYTVLEVMVLKPT